MQYYNRAAGAESPRAQLWARELLAAALAYATREERPLPVFPAAVINRRKQPLVKIGRGEAHGTGASTDPVQIRAWWRRWPLALIGMPTGRASGIDVLDVDRKGGVDGLETLRALGINPFELTSIVSQTPSGGFHFFFAAGQIPLRNSAGLIGPGVDVRGQGGIVFLPPSIPDIEDPEIRHYCWEWGHARI